jgi:CubicO group peptidase (beta-lactamase class C family)
MKKHLQKRLTVLVIILILFSSILNAQINPVLAAQLQQGLNLRVQNYGNHGVSACVIMPNGDIWKGTAGVGQASVAITDSTVFHGASITKTNIATLILLLAEDGLLNLDSSWTKYVTINATFNPAITLRQLLNHTSGIADYLEVVGSGTFITNNFNHAFTPLEILENIVSGTPDFAPGTNFNYSTSNYVLAALIAQTITGNPVAQELRTRIWSPLGMTHTYFGGFETYTEPRAGVWWDFGSGLVNYSNNPETSMLTFGYGGANIVSTPEDLARFARALFTGSILSQASMNEMQTFSTNSYTSWCKGYGLGIHNSHLYSNNSVLGHDGDYTNMSDMFHSYDYGFTLVTMSNTEKQWFGIFDGMYTTIKNYMTLGIKENTNSSSLDLFPNPATNDLTINLGSTNKNAEITITDITGKIIYTTTSTEAKLLEVSTKDFSSGVYVVQIKTANFIETKKLIVSR